MIGDMNYANYIFLEVSLYLVLLLLLSLMNLAKLIPGICVLNISVNMV
jgi:hypothetical protein